MVCGLYHDGHVGRKLACNYPLNWARCGTMMAQVFLGQTN